MVTYVISWRSNPVRHSCNQDYTQELYGGVKAFVGFSNIPFLFLWSPDCAHRFSYFQIVAVHDVSNFGVAVWVYWLQQVVVAYNPLGWAREEFIRIPVSKNRTSFGSLKEMCKSTSRLVLCFLRDYLMYVWLSPEGRAVNISSPIFTARTHISGRWLSWTWSV